MKERMIWGGIPGARMQWLPAPAAGLSRTHVHWTDSTDLMNGKLASKRSNQYRIRFEMDFPLTEAAGQEGLDVYPKFASGFYGDGVTDGKFYFVDPFSNDNLFPAEWASPGLWQRGWSRIADEDPTAVNDTAPNTLNQPPTSVNYTVYGEEVPNTRTIIAVPPGYRLYYGMTGQSMVTGRGLAGRPIAEDGSYGAITYVEGLDVTDPVRMNSWFDGSSTCVAVEFFLYDGASGGAPRTLPVTSMMARLYAPDESPVLTGDHEQGMGHHGLEFTDDAMPQTYEYITGRLKGLSTALEETL